MQATECSTQAERPCYTAARSYVESFIDYEKKRDYQYNPRTFNLVRMERLLAFLGAPHEQLKVVHVAGSKGKGSTSAMLASMLTAAGYRTGLYTSPHLISSRERFRIGENLISEHDFVVCLDRLRPALESMRASGNPPSFFEIYTAMAFVYFVQQQVDLAVLEVGLGGRLDATNVVPGPEVCAITPVSHEHTAILGDNLAAIAAEKAGIIKPGRPVVVGPQPPDALSTIQRVCDEREAPLIDASSDTAILRQRPSLNGQQFDLKTPNCLYQNLELPLLGQYQADNAAIAVRTVESLSGFRVGSDAVAKGLKNVVWPGRLQVISSAPFLVLDGAHSVASVQALRDAISESFTYDRLILVAGFSQDKAIRSMGEILAPHVSDAIITQASNTPRAADPAAVRDTWSGLIDHLHVVPTVAPAIELAISLASPEDLICVTGSLYVVGETLQYLGYKPDEFGSGMVRRNAASGVVHNKVQEGIASPHQPG